MSSWSTPDKWSILLPILHLLNLKHTTTSLFTNKHWNSMIRNPALNKYKDSSYWLGEEFEEPRNWDLITKYASILDSVTLYSAQNRPHSLSIPQFHCKHLTLVNFNINSTEQHTFYQSKHIVTLVLFNCMIQDSLQLYDSINLESIHRGGDGKINTLGIMQPMQYPISLSHKRCMNLRCIIDVFSGYNIQQIYILLANTPSLESLNIDYNENNLDDSDTIIPSNYRSKLTHLIIRSNHAVNQSDNQTQKDILQTLLQHCPNLSHLQLHIQWGRNTQIDCTTYITHLHQLEYIMISLSLYSGPFSSLTHQCQLAFAPYQEPSAQDRLAHIHTLKQLWVCYFTHLQCNAPRLLMYCKDKHVSNTEDYNYAIKQCHSVETRYNHNVFNTLNK